VAAIPEPWRSSRQLWIRIDSAGYSRAVIDAATAHSAAFSITCGNDKRVRAAIYELATSTETTWVPALSVDGELAGSELAECRYSLGGRELRMIVRRQRKSAGSQLAFDDLGGWRFHAIVTNIPSIFCDIATIEHHHRLRGGAPEEAIRQLKHDFGLNHAPLQSFLGNWCWWLASALAYNVARWIRVLALPEAFRTSRGKRLRLSFFNVAARVTRRGRQIHLRLPRAYPHARTFIAAMVRLRALPAFA
jgi:hypothetical protein